MREILVRYSLSEEPWLSDVLINAWDYIEETIVDRYPGTIMELFLEGDIVGVRLLSRESWLWIMDMRQRLARTVLVWGIGVNEPRSVTDF